ncbi:DsrE/DsrF/DrsH-like family protein [Thomasclavelia cocleata]|uniref:DsrE/DsrF/DrsH-like family protein n=1 Tax=Thomasclavelia cocleata TaxID=69824 RepID=UPI0020118F2D|nr:DsrE/DsrF/DrsH-like family protein [Thomasclavelia cocleata]
MMLPHFHVDGSVTLLDTRSELEYANGHIDGYINIPLDSLRSRLHELDINKPVYVTCQIGLRGYIASRILSQNGFETYNLNGGYRLYNTIFDQNYNKSENNTIKSSSPLDDIKTIKVNACGLQCPGPIVKLSATLETAKDGDIIEIQTTDPAFASDLDGYCRRTGNELIELSCNKGISNAKIKKGQQPILTEDKNNKNMIIFSGDLDKAIASFIIANGAAAMGRKVTMFFTFWGLNIIRRPEKIKTKKNLISKMFAMMMPRGSKKLSLSKMNMGGMGAKMIRAVMKDKNIDSLEDLIKTAQDNGVELIACSMSMDVMGIKNEELIDGVKLSGVATMLANGEESDMSLFI